MLIRLVYEIKEHLASLSSNGEVSLQLNRIAWNGGESKIDLRRWKGDSPWKGLCMSIDEARALLAALEGYFEPSERRSGKIT